MGASCKGSLMTTTSHMSCPLKREGSEDLPPQYRETTSLGLPSFIPLLHSLFCSFLVLGDLAADLFLQCLLFSDIPQTKSYTVILPFLIISAGSFPSFSMSFRLFLFLPCSTFQSSSLFSLLFYPSCFLLILISLLHHLLFYSLSPVPLATFYLNCTMPAWTHAF